MGFLCDQTTDERVHVDLFIIRSSRSYFSIFTSSRFFNQTFPRSFAKEKIMSRMLKQNIQAINVRLSNTHTCPHVPARICSRKAYNWVNQQGNSSDCAWERETEREREIIFSWIFCFSLFVWCPQLTGQLRCQRQLRDSKETQHMRSSSRSERILKDN